MNNAELVDCREIAMENNLRVEHPGKTVDLRWRCYGDVNARYLHDVDCSTHAQGYCTWTEKLACQAYPGECFVALFLLFILAYVTWCAVACCAPYDIHGKKLRWGKEAGVKARGLKL